MRILCLGDSPFLRTGFGVVNEVAVNEFLDGGHDVVILGGQDKTERKVDIDNFTFIPISGDHDMLGWTQADKVIEQYQPDIIHIVGDPATITTWFLLKSVTSRPCIVYMPVEGAPLNVQWVTALKNHDSLALATCSQFGQRVLAEAGIPAAMAYHGVSDDFRPDPEKRAEWRDRLGWADRFVVMCVAQNVRRKQWPRLFEALALIKDSDVMLYAHTVPFNNYWLEGHDLAQLAEQIGVWDKVYFPPSHDKHNAHIATAGNADRPGLNDLYNVADMFVLPSQVEGFGLPLAEAMKVGLPTATTAYAAGSEVVGGAGILLDVHDWEWNKSHSRYANVSPRAIADAIVRVKRNPELQKQYRRRSLERSKTFTWDAYRAFLRESVGDVQTSTTAATDHPDLQNGGRATKVAAVA